jgi:hypothetical protein
LDETDFGECQRRLWTATFQSQSLRVLAMTTPLSEKAPPGRV